MLFDCPICGLPAEIKETVYRIVDGFSQTFVVIGCSGVHEPCEMTFENFSRMMDAQWREP